MTGEKERTAQGAALLEPGPRCRGPGQLPRHNHQICSSALGLAERIREVDLRAYDSVQPEASCPDSITSSSQYQAQKKRSLEWFLGIFYYNNSLRHGTLSSLTSPGQRAQGQKGNLLTGGRQEAGFQESKAKAVTLLQTQHRTPAAWLQIHSTGNKKITVARPESGEGELDSTSWWQRSRSHCRRAGSVDAGLATIFGK